ncbi:FAD-binding protein [Acidocella sp. MX-AZ03]|uniref:FAD-dependent oxidoreductase n=1 Tax=Acidocella sp. MX-AZ03 TaxID=2697363 RepID=UPI0022DDF0F2|nr:FAD-dependent oxidoreductase [Acidocella sp. MX-AZ03]WBO58461.1 FAD-binding protein [Acidocella sp. MX-AZ03]
MKSAYDVIVLGAGAAGMAACLFARLNGLSALLVERTAHLGGTSAFSAATIWVPGSPLAASVGAPPDDIDQARRFLNETVGTHASAAMREAFLRWGRKPSPGCRTRLRCNCAPGRCTLIISRTRQGRACAAAPWSRCPSMGAPSASAWR